MLPSPPAAATVLGMPHFFAIAPGPKVVLCKRPGIYRDHATLEPSPFVLVCRGDDNRVASEFG